MQLGCAKQWDFLLMAAKPQRFAVSDVSKKNLPLVTLNWRVVVSFCW